MTTMLQRYRQGGGVSPDAVVVFGVVVLLVAGAFLWRYQGYEKDIKISTMAVERGGGEIVVNVHDDGSLTVNGAIHTEQELSDMLSEIVKTDQDHSVILRGDQKTGYKRIMNALNICKDAGVQHVAFAAGTP